MPQRNIDSEYSRKFLERFLHESKKFPEGFAESNITGKHELYVYAGSGKYYPFVEVHRKGMSEVNADTSLDYKVFLMLDLFVSLSHIPHLTKRYRDLTWIMFWAEYMHWENKYSESNPYSRNPYDYVWLLEQNIPHEQKIRLLSCGVYKEADGKLFNELPSVFWTPLTDKVDMLASHSLKQTLHLHI